MKLLLSCLFYVKILQNFCEDFVKKGANGLTI
jgi:hypothetical protein